VLIIILIIVTMLRTKHTKFNSKQLLTRQTRQWSTAIGYKYYIVFIIDGTKFARDCFSWTIQENPMTFLPKFLWMGEINSNIIHVMISLTGWSLYNTF